METYRRQTRKVLDHRLSFRDCITVAESHLRAQERSLAELRELRRRLEGADER